MEDTGLTKAARSIKSEFAIFLLIFFSISIGSYLVFRITRNQEPPPQNVGYENTIFPNKTTKNQVKAQLGEPLKIDTDGNSETYLYPTENEFREDKIRFSNETVSIIKEQVIGTENGTLSDYLSKYGQQESILYGGHGTFAPGYFWGTKGLLVFANPKGGTIFEIWYFKPTTQIEFLSNHPDITDKESHTENL